MNKRRLVYICSPYKGDYIRNTIQAHKYCGFATDMGYLPIAPHIYFTTFLSDTIPIDRREGMEMGLQLLEICEEVWVFGIDKPSAGMAAEILRAAALNMPIRDGWEIVQNNADVGENVGLKTPERAGNAK